MSKFMTLIILLVAMPPIRAESADSDDIASTRQAHAILADMLVNRWRVEIDGSSEVISRPYKGRRCKGTLPPPVPQMRGDAVDWRLVTGTQAGQTEDGGWTITLDGGGKDEDMERALREAVRRAPDGTTFRVPPRRRVLRFDAEADRDRALTAMRYLTARCRKEM